MKPVQLVVIVIVLMFCSVPLQAQQTVATNTNAAVPILTGQVSQDNQSRGTLIRRML